jgi:hypothetical protein
VRRSQDANGTVLVITGGEQVAPDGVSVLGTDGAASAAPPASDVVMAIIGGGVDDSVYSFQFLQNGTIDLTPTVQLLSQHKAMTGQVVPESWILLDNQSTVDVFCNKNLLRNIRAGTTMCRISCNAGTAEMKLIGDLLGYPTPVWYHPNGIANILSSHRVSKRCRVVYNSTEEVKASFHVTKQDGSVLHFRPSMSGLHYCDQKKTGIPILSTPL